MLKFLAILPHFFTQSKEMKGVIFFLEVPSHNMVLNLPWTCNHTLKTKHNMTYKFTYKFVNGAIKLFLYIPDFFIFQNV